MLIRVWLSAVAAVHHLLAAWRLCLQCLVQIGVAQSAWAADSDTAFSTNADAVSYGLLAKDAARWIA